MIIIRLLLTMSAVVGAVVGSYCWHRFYSQIADRRFNSWVKETSWDSPAVVWMEAVAGVGLEQAYVHFLFWITAAGIAVLVWNRKWK